MKNIFTALFFGLMGAATVTISTREAPEQTQTVAAVTHTAPKPTSPAKPAVDPNAPIPMEPIRQISPPPTQTTWLNDAELETKLLLSLKHDPSIKDLASVQSVNCEGLRCQVLVEPVGDINAPQAAFFAHLEANPEFGRSLRISPNTDKENKKLLTFTYSQETQVSTTH